MWVALAALVVVLAGAIAWALLDRVNETVNADCTLVLPGERYTVLADGAGAVEEILVDAGAVVGAGQPLARVRIPGLERQLAFARAVLAELEAQLDSSAEGSTSPTLAAARAEVRQLEATRETGQVVSSPVTGEVTSISLTPGQWVEGGSPIALIRVGEGTRLEAVAYVPRDDARLLQPGQRATIVRLTVGDDALNAAVSAVSDRPTAAEDWLVDLGLSALPRSHLVTLSLADTPSIELADGEGCQVRVVVGTHAPIRLLGAARLAGHGSA